MDTTIITVLITGGLSAAASIIVASIQHRKTAALLEYRLQELEKKVDKHNNLVERTYELEKNAAVVSRELKVLGHRITEQNQ